ncbi:MAG: ComF family protein [Neomegalonema sp.]|nr:ComF family protein [Neomegalonema sp.]
MAHALITAALDWLYPPSCMACGAPTERAGALCGACWRDMRQLDNNACAICAAPFAYDIPNLPPHCADCAESPRGWRRGAAVCLYEGVGRDLVLALKHGDRLDAAKSMGAWMARAGAALLAAERGEAPMLVPIPLHWTRRAKRRFNQSLELARAVAAASDATLAADVLRRPRATPSQGGLDRKARRQNVDGAFALRKSAIARINGRRVVLIDDVMTTGATLSSAASHLRAAGASQIDVLVFARAARDPLALALNDAISPLHEQNAGNGATPRQSA